MKKSLLVITGMLLATTAINAEMQMSNIIYKLGEEIIHEQDRVVIDQEGNIDEYANEYKPSGYDVVSSSIECDDFGCTILVNVENTFTEPVEPEPSPETSKPEHGEEVEPEPTPESNPEPVEPETHKEEQPIIIVNTATKAKGE